MNRAWWTRLCLDAWLRWTRVPVANMLRRERWFVRLVLPLLQVLGGGRHGRRAIADRNLTLCFPLAQPAQRKQWLTAHLTLFLRALWQRAWLWQADEASIRRAVSLRGVEHLERAKAQGPVIMLAPHFLGLDAAWTRLCLDWPMVTLYGKQKNPLLDEFILRGRGRWGRPLLFSRQDGVRHLVREVKRGRILYYLPDMDFGPKDSVFAPFFGMPTATVTAVGRLAKLLNATVLPCLALLRDAPADDALSQGGNMALYDVQILPPLSLPLSDPLGEPQPGQDGQDVMVAAAMNAAIEGWVREHIPQYFWLHKRFKTRPSGDMGVY